MCVIIFGNLGDDTFFVERPRNSCVYFPDHSYLDNLSCADNHQNSQSAPAVLTNQTKQHQKDDEVKTAAPIKVLAKLYKSIVQLLRFTVTQG